MQMMKAKIGISKKDLEPPTLMKNVLQKLFLKEKHFKSSLKSDSEKKIKNHE